MWEERSRKKPAEYYSCAGRTSWILEKGNRSTHTSSTCIIVDACPGLKERSAATLFRHIRLCVKLAIHCSYVQKNSSCSLAVSLAGCRGYMGAWGQLDGCLSGVEKMYTRMSVRHVNKNSSSCQHRVAATADTVRTSRKIAVAACVAVAGRGCVGDGARAVRILSSIQFSDFIKNITIKSITF
jgi:hypothetical protein